MRSDTRAADRREGLSGRRLGQLLVADGTISATQLGQALTEQTRTNERLGTVLVGLGFITEEQLIGSLARGYGVSIATLPESAVDADLLQLVPLRTASRYDVIPIGRTDGTLTLAMADPGHLPAIDDVTFVSGLRVVPAIAPLSAIRRAIQLSYPASDILTSAEANELELLDHNQATVQSSLVDLAELKASTDQAPVVRIVNRIFLDALDRGASDIHLEPSETSLRVRFRIDGILHEVKTLPKRSEAAIVSRIKIMASLDIAERRLPQDGRIKLRYQDREIDLRINTLPMIFGESASIRILDKEVVKLDIRQLGFDPRGLEEFQKAILSPHGMVLMTGPTGSGKTTTLYSAIHSVRSPHVNILTVEDPVEYYLEGINQVQVNEEIGRTFATVLRSFLRHDPDIILVGEMRDLETAQIAVRAALTGHLVLTTLHANDSPSSVARLVEIGIGPAFVSGSLRVVVAQRLVRKVCQGCKEPYEATKEGLVLCDRILTGGDKYTLYAGKGCMSCHFTGMKGRTALFEVLPVTESIRTLINENAPTHAIREVARQEGMKTLREVGLSRVLEGVTTVAEVLRVTSE